MESTEKSSIKKKIFEYIVNGQLPQVVDFIKNNPISAIEITETVKKAFQQLLEDKNYFVAIQLCEQFNLPVEMRLEAVNTQFRKLIKNREFEKAVEWGLKNNIPRTDIENVAMKAFKEALHQKNVEKALGIKDKYNISAAFIGAEAIHFFNIFYENKNYVKALLIGQEFDVSRKRSLTAGIRGYQGLISSGDIQRMIELEQKYNILGDREITQVEENDENKFIDTFIQDFFRNFLSSNKADKLSQIIESLELFQKRGNNPLVSRLIHQISEEVIYVHTNLMESLKYSDAFRLVENFHLFSDEIVAESKSKIITAAQKAHNKLIEENKLQAAKLIKDNYELFSKNIIADSLDSVSRVIAEYLEKALEKGDIENALFVVKEYDVQQNNVRIIAGKAIAKMLQSRKFLEAFDTIKMLKIPPNNQLFNAEALSCFEDAYNNGQMELASNIGFYFRIKDERVVQATFMLWKNQIESGRYSRAIEIRKQHKIPKKLSEPVVKEIYKNLLTQGETDQAVHLRNTYQMHLSVWAWFMEILRKVLK